MFRIAVTTLALVTLLLPRGMCVCGVWSSCPSANCVAVAIETQASACSCNDDHHDDQVPDDGGRILPDENAPIKHGSLCQGLAKVVEPAPLSHAVVVDVTPVSTPNFEDSESSSFATHIEPAIPYITPPIYLVCCALLI